MKLIRFSIIVLLSALLFMSCKKQTPTPMLIVDAGVSQSIQLPANVVTLIGTIKSGQTTNMNYAWLLLSGPNVPTIVNAASSATAVESLVAGTYIFQFQVTNSNGLTAVDTTSVTVLPANVNTLTLQPADNPNEGHVDSYNIYGGGGDSILEIAAGTINGNSTDWRSYVKFDFSSIPAGAVIDNATLYLYGPAYPYVFNEGNANAFYVERITAAWSASQLNYNNLPTTTSVNSVLVPATTVPFSQDNQVIGVTTLIQDMQTDGNYGFGLRLQNEVIYNTRLYASSYGTNASLHPKLIITYH